MSSIESTQQNEDKSSMTPTNENSIDVMVSSQRPQHHHQHSFTTDDRMNMLFHSVQSIDSASNIEDILKSNASLGITFETSPGCPVPTSNASIFSSRSAFALGNNTSPNGYNMSSISPSQSLDPLFTSNLFSSRSWAPTLLDSHQLDFSNIFHTNASVSSVSTAAHPSRPGKFDFNAMFQSQLANNPLPFPVNNSHSRLANNSLLNHSHSLLVKNANIEKDHRAVTSTMITSDEKTAPRSGKYDFNAMFHSQLPQNPTFVPHYKTPVPVNPLASNSGMPSHDSSRENLHSESSSSMPPPFGLSNQVVADAKKDFNKFEPLSFNLEADAAIALHSLSNSSSSQQVPRSISLQSSNAVMPAQKPKRKRTRPNYEPQVKVFVNPTPEDVLLGRGGRTNHHPGNNRYLQAKASIQDRYMKASKDEKTSISQELVTIVKGWGGRFLKLDAASDNWYEVTNLAARKKASQSLREINTAEERAAKRARYSRQKNGSSCSDSLNDDG
jgi:hypothetical protein